MACRVERDDKRVLRLIAEDRIGNLGIAGDLAITEPEPAEVFLDDPDDPAALMTVGWWVRIYARDAAALDRLRPHIPASHKHGGSEEIGFAGVAGWVQDALADEWETVWENRCLLHHLEPDDHEPALVTHDVLPLRPEHAGRVNDSWEHADAPEYVRWMIERGPTAAVYEDGQPVSWAVIHDDNSMGLMYTAPEARGKGYALSVTAALSGETLRRGRVPYFYTVQENEPAQKLAERAGFRRWGDYRYFGAVRG